MYEVHLISYWAYDQQVARSINWAITNIALHKATKKERNTDLRAPLASTMKKIRLAVEYIKGQRRKGGEEQGGQKRHPMQLQMDGLAKRAAKMAYEGVSVCLANNTHFPWPYHMHKCVRL